MRIIFLCMAAISLFVPMALIATAAQDKETEPLALIGNTPITQDDLDKRVLSLPAKVRELYENPQGREELLMEMVRTEIFSREAEAQGLTKDKTIQAKIQDLRKTLLASEYTKRKVLAKSEISDAEALQYYESHRDQFKQPEQIKAPSLFIKIPSSASEEVIKKLRAKADSLLARAKGGEDFIQLAHTHTDSSFQDDVKFFKRGRLLPEVEDVVFSLKPGELSPVLEIKDGLIFFKLLERQPEQPLSYADVKQDLLHDLREKKINKLFEAEERRLLDRYKVSFQKKIEKTAASMDTNRTESVQGHIVEISPAQKNTVGKSLGTVLIEDKKSSGLNERIAVIVVPETIIVHQSAGKERPISFAELKRGQAVTVQTHGPKMQSYPPQAKAQRIIIKE